MKSGDRVDVALYERLIEAFKQKPGNKSHASREAKSSREVAARAWAFGWPDKGLAPIRQVLADEKLGARILIRKRFTQEAVEDDPVFLAAQAREQAILATAEEGTMIADARLSVISAFNQVADLMREVGKLGKKVGEFARDAGPLEQLEVMGRVGLLARDLSKAGQTIMEMERLRLGEPSKIIGVKPVGMTMAEAQKELEAANVAFKRAKELGIIDAPKQLEAGK